MLGKVNVSNAVASNYDARKKKKKKKFMHVVFSISINCMGR